MSSDSSSIAAIRFAKRANIDGLLLDVVSSLRRTGIRLGGLLQSADGATARHATSVSVLDLHTGDRFEIWDPRGQGARACRLDEHGLARAEAAVLASLDAGIDLVVLNRFGRAESKGRGLTACFIEAMIRGVPILTAVREPFDGDWNRFHGGLATELPASPAPILRWAHGVIGTTGRATPDAAQAMSV